MLARLASPIAALAALIVSPLHAADPPPAPGALPQIDCKAVAGRPGSPMSVEQCERQQSVTNSMQQALSTPGGERPGDDKMTCEQIVAELQQQPPMPGVSPENRAESVAAGNALKSAQDAAMTDAQATMALGTAPTAAAAVASTLPGGGVFASSAMAAQAGRQQALVARHSPAMNDARNRAMTANANSMVDVTSMMQANPRFARLAMLAGMRGCSGNF
jgi:hypothetical protein